MNKPIVTPITKGRPPCLYVKLKIEDYRIGKVLLVGILVGKVRGGRDKKPQGFSFAREPSSKRFLQSGKAKRRQPKPKRSRYPACRGIVGERRRGRQVSESGSREVDCPV